MYGDLKSKLEMYKSSRTEKVEKLRNTGMDVQDILEGVVCSNEFGEYFMIEKEYLLSHVHGGYKIGDAAEINLLSLSGVCSDLNENCSIQDFLFMDTETTGLSGGAGTVAFLIGIGFFTADTFILRQYFMRDYDEECALLNDLNNHASAYKGLITFNGKTFDWNLLQSRFAFNRIRRSLKEPIHIDLLFPSRRIWKLKLESCRLGTLEENILGVYRVDDIPGAMIPSVYFKYLDDRNACDIKRIISHNELDILSMISLLTKISCMLENPLFETDCERELLGVGRIFENAEDYDKVIGCYETCINSESTFIKESASRRLGDIYKKSKDYDKAVEHWSRMVSETETLNLYPVIELAKYYEHKQKDIGRAMEMVERAMQQISQIGLNNSIQYEDVRKRYERLKRKAGRDRNA